MNMDKKETALLLDLAKLMVKYGPETFGSLAANLMSKDMSDLAGILSKYSRAGSNHEFAASYHTKKPNLSSELRTLATTNPEKYATVYPFYLALRGKEILPHSGDIKEFAKKNNLPLLEASDRSSLTSALVRELLTLPTLRIREVLSKFGTYGQSSSTLRAWSDIITKDMSRSGANSNQKY